MTPDENRVNFGVNAVNKMDSQKAHEETPPRWRGRQKLLPGDAIRRLKADLSNATGMEPVVVYADDLRTLIEVVEHKRGPGASDARG
jgi:hypothetical protein